VPEHDRLRGPNVITTLTTPHGFTAQAIAALRSNMPPEYAALCEPRIAVLLGGANGDYRYSPAALQRLWRALKALGASGASFLITPSRRTEPAIIECARLATQGFPRMIWDMRGHNPYAEYLAFANMVLSPADSINMTSEACATGRPVYVFHPDGGSPKFTRFHTALCRHGATRPFPDTLGRMDRWSYEPLTSAALIADHISTRFAASVGAGQPVF
jgi:mitochondrial fission protein ELM1